MNIPDRSIALKCLFCHSELKGPEDANYSSGDLIKCQECGEENDFDSVVEVAKETGIAEVKKEVEDQLAKAFKGLFK